MLVKLGFTLQLGGTQQRGGISKKREGEKIKSTNLVSVLGIPH